MQQDRFPAAAAAAAAAITVGRGAPARSATRRRALEFDRGARIMRSRRSRGTRSRWTSQGAAPAHSPITSGTVVGAAVGRGGGSSSCRTRWRRASQQSRGRRSGRRTRSRYRRIRYQWYELPGYVTPYKLGVAQLADRFQHLFPAINQVGLTQQPSAVPPALLQAARAKTTPTFIRTQPG